MDLQFVKVKNIFLAGTKVFKVSLMVDEPVSFLPGQYLKIWQNEWINRCYSIAAPYSFKNQIEVLIGWRHSDSVASNLIEQMRCSHHAKISFPYGNACYHNNMSKILFIIVCGTGYAYGRCILLQALQNSAHEKIYFWWFVRAADEIIQDESIRLLKNAYAHLDFFIFIVADQQILPTLQKEIQKPAAKDALNSTANVFIAANQSVVTQITNLLLNLGKENLTIVGDLVKCPILVC